MADTPDPTPDQRPDPDPATRPGPAPRDPSRWLRRALLASVAVNLLVIGTVAGVVLSHGDRDDRQARAERGAGFGRYVRALDPADRAALREAYRAGAGRDAIAAHRAGHRADHAALLAAVRSDPFDRAAVEGIFEGQIARMTEGMMRGQGLLVDRIAAMSVGERAAFADRLERMARRHDDRRGPDTDARDGRRDGDGH